MRFKEFANSQGNLLINKYEESDSLQLIPMPADTGNSLLQLSTSNNEEM